MKKKAKKLKANEITKVILIGSSSRREKENGLECLRETLFFRLMVEKTLNREIGRKSWCHNGAEIVKLWLKKMGFQNFNISASHKNSSKISFRTIPRARTRKSGEGNPNLGFCNGMRNAKGASKEISVPSSPASLHCGWTSTISSREHPMDNRRLCLCVPKHFDKSRRCRWLLSRSCGCKVCSKLSLLWKLETSCRAGEMCEAEWWCCLLPLIWLRLWRDIIYGGPKGPVNVYDPLRGHSCDSADEAAAVLDFFYFQCVEEWKLINKLFNGLPPSPANNATEIFFAFIVFYAAGLLCGRERVTNFSLLETFLCVFSVKNVLFLFFSSSLT